MDKIKKAVEEFKQENGNKEYQLDDLVIYILKRVDNLPCEKHASTISLNRGTLLVVSAIIVGLAVKIACF
jgi:hypothetical protein